MPTEHDFYEALREGRWQPHVDLGEDKGEFYASYSQDKDTVVIKRSKYSSQQAQDDLREELLNGTLEGKYYPQF